MRDEILEAYDIIDVMDILQEECAELICACSKYKRCKGHGFRTKASLSETVDNLIEEIADVEGILRTLKYLIDVDDDTINKIIDAKEERSVERLREGKEDNG